MLLQLLSSPPLTQNDNFADEGLWDILIKDIPREATLHTFNMDNLKQGVSYDFRVIGVNDYGYGSPSLPSPSISGELLCIRSCHITEIYPDGFSSHRFQFSLLLFFTSSSKSGTFLRGVVVPGGGGAGGAHLHPAAGLHPHYQGTEQEVCQEVRIR